MGLPYFALAARQDSLFLKVIYWPRCARAARSGALEI
jgi:hypothetical protein